MTATVDVVEDLGGDQVRVATVAETDRVVLEGEATILSVPHEHDR